MTNLDKLCSEPEKVREIISRLIDRHDDDDCIVCPAYEFCTEGRYPTCRQTVIAWMNQEAEPMPEAPREAGGYVGHGPVCIPGWGGNRTVYVDSHGRVHEIGCGGAGSRAYDINGELILALPE